MWLALPMAPEDVVEQPEATVKSYLQRLGAKKESPEPELPPRLKTLAKNKISKPLYSRGL
jgi:hypothetical protein